MSTRKEYTNGEVTIVWKPDLCIHSANCVRGLPKVFDNRKRPWINAEGASSDAIIKQVGKCPSGALTIYRNDKNMAEKNDKVIITLAKDGPILVKGAVHLENEKGETIPTGSTSAFCRCGGSGNKPFCDGTHRKNGFTG